MNSKINAIITGATGMVGEGVLYVALKHPDVLSVLVINRRPSGVTHSKLRELILPDLSDLSTIESRLTGNNACFFCAGVSSVGMKEPEYTKVTYDLTLSFAKSLCRLNPDMTFCYVSGAGTDSSEKGKMMWARVKGKTENDLMKLPFRAVHAFRPAFMKPTEGQKNVSPYYKYIGWLYPIMHRISPAWFGTLEAVGLAMIRCIIPGTDKKILEAKDIAALAGEDAS